MDSSVFNCYLVPTAGLEPAQLSPLPPQDSVSTNFTTSAINLLTTTILRPAAVYHCRHLQGAQPAAEHFHLRH